MEATPGKPLTPREKEKLKEQLDFLKREYSKTFHRLQRAERAERVKNCIKKRTTGQNELLPQKEVEKDCEESISQMEAAEQVLVSAFLEPSTAKATFVGLESEVVPREDSLSENSGSECITPDPESGLFCPTGPQLERKRNRLSRSRTKVQQRVTLALGMRGEPASDVLQENAGHDWGCETASTGSSVSPIFKRRCSTLEPDQSTPNTPSMAEERDCGVVVAQPESLGQNVCHGASCPLSNAWSHKNQVPSLNSLGIFANPESSAVEKPVIHDNVPCGEQVSVQVEKEQVGAGEEESGRAFLGGGAAPCVSGHRTLEGRLQYEKTDENLDLDNGQMSFLSSAAEMGLGSQGEAGPPILEKTVPAAPTESPLSTCTVVEGLLFPVEYYVRTTRRMSRCQRKVDLAAVLQGQLGKKRREQGVSQKDSGATPGLPSQEPAGSECQLGSAPLSASGTYVDRRCDSLSLLPPLPLSNAVGQGLTQHRRGRRPRGRAGRRVSSGPLPELPPSEDRCCLMSCEAQDWGVALPVRSCVVVRPAEPDLAASRCPEAKLEGVQSSCTTIPGTESGISFMRDLDVSSIEVPCPERRTWEQEGSQSSSGAELESLDAARLPWCKPLDAAQESEGAPPGGKGSNLLMESWGHPEPLNAKSQPASQNNLPSPLHLEEFQLPGHKHGPQACVVEQLDILDSAQSVENLQCAGPGAGSAAGENLCNVSLEKDPHGSPHTQWPLHMKEFPSRKLLLSPAPEGVASQLESQLPTSIFPLVGATPASQPLLGVSPLQVKGSWSKPEDGARQRPGEAAGVGLKESQSSARQSVEHCRESALQIDTAAEALQDSPREWNLQMTAELKASSSSCSVDLSAVLWGEAGSAEFCIAIACEASVSLWRCLESGHWGVLHTWHFAEGKKRKKLGSKFLLQPGQPIRLLDLRHVYSEVPVSQIVPLPDVHSVLCVALGGWEIAQIRFLFQSSKDGGPEHSQVKAGDIKAILGLKNRRLVVSCGTLPNQTIEVVFFSEAGRSQKRKSLMPPQENISTFAEVDGMQDALVGLTAANCAVIWNLITGQLLRRIPVGQPDPNSVCHKVFSNSGLLFAVLSCPHAKESKADRTAAFEVIALNPKTAKSTGVTLLSLPQGIAGRYVEGNVRGTSAAAVLTSGTIAVWDLLWGQCTALLPPSREGSWTLVRWSTMDDCLLARRTDGSVHLYSYTARLPCS